MVLLLPAVPAALAAAGSRTTKATVSCVPAVRQVGEATTCTATVTDTDAAPQSTPTGDVSFSSDISGGGSFSNGGSCTLGAGSGASASCPVTYTPSAPGTHTISVLYLGDGSGASGHAPNSNNDHSATITVTAGGSGRTTSTSVACSPSPVAVGQPSMCTATVTDTDTGTQTTPSGTVSFSSGTSGGMFSGGGSCTLSGSGSSASCSVTYTPGQLGSGTHQISAQYTGDSTHAASTGSFPLGVTGAAGRSTSTSVVCSPSSVVVGQASTCTATVADTASGTTTTPTGTVSFSSDTSGGTFAGGGSCTLGAGSGASASCAVTYTPGQLGSGAERITATYLGDGSHSASAGSFVLAVSSPARPTQLAVSCSPGIVVVGNPSTCTATVTDVGSGAPSTPTGTVSFATDSEGSFGASSCALAGTGTVGQASCQVIYTPSAVDSGQHFISGFYSPSDGVHGSSAASTRLGVLAAGLRDTTTSVSCAPSTVLIGQATSCTATVTDTGPGAPVTPSGMVLFSARGDGTTFDQSGEGTFTSPSGGSSNGTLSCALAVTSTPGRASCQLAFTPTANGEFAFPGARIITAAYQGGSHNPSQGSVTVQSVKRSTVSAVTCQARTLTVGGSTRCTITITDTAPAGAKSFPLGDVRWFQSPRPNVANVRDLGGLHGYEFCSPAPTGIPGRSACEVLVTPYGPSRLMLGAAFIPGTSGPSRDHSHAASGSADVTLTTVASAAQAAAAQSCLASSAATYTGGDLPGGLGGQATGDLVGQPTGDLFGPPSIPTDFPVVDPGSLDASAVAVGPSLSSGLGVARDLPGPAAVAAASPKHARMVTIASVQQTFTTTGRKHIRLRLTAAALRALRSLAARHRGFRFTLIFRYTPAHGGPVQITRRVITIHARRPPALLTVAHASTTLHPGKAVIRQQKPSRAVGKLLRKAARRHQRVRLLLFVRIVNPGGQTVLAYKTITLTLGQRGHARASAADATQTITTCNPVPGAPTPPANLAAETHAATTAVDQLATTAMQQTQTGVSNTQQDLQKAAQDAFQIAQELTHPVFRSNFDRAPQIDADLLNRIEHDIRDQLDSRTGQLGSAPLPPSAFDPAALAAGPMLGGGLPV